MSKFGITISRLSTSIALVFFAGAALAQSATPAAPSGGLMQQVQQTQAEIQQINQQLAQIQQAAIEANPELAAQRDSLLASVNEKMIEAGHDPDASREKMTDMQAQIEGGELSTEESQAVAQEIRQAQAELQQAQREVMQEESIQTEIQSLNDGLVEAMQAQNPQTGQLIAQLQTAQQEYQALMQQAMQQQGAMQQQQSQADGG